MSMMNRVVPGLLFAAAAIALSGCGKSSSGASPGNGDRAAAQAPAGNMQVMAIEVAEISEPEAPAPVVAAIAEDPDHDHAHAEGGDGVVSERERLKKISAGDDPLAPMAPTTVVLDPVALDLGKVPANTNGAGSVTLTNTGDKTVTIDDCRASCGCTTTNCPKGKQLQPGESTSVEVRMTAGAKDRHVSKTVTFVIDGNPALRLPVSLDVVTYVAIEPETIDPEKSPDGRVVIRATDDQPFRIVAMQPEILTDLITEPTVEHELFVPWDKWRELGQPRRLTFTLDHPQADRIQLNVRVAAPPRPEQPEMSSDRKAPPRNALDSAAAQDDSENLLGRPVDFVSPDSKLAVAVKRGDLAGVNDALVAGVKPEVRDSMLAMAARYGNLEIVDVLLQAGANVGATDKRGRTPLMSAIQSRNPDVVKALIKGGADVNARDEVQCTALFRAAGPFGDAAIVGALLQSGAEVNLSDKNGMTPLMWAVRFGDAGRVQELITAGADVGARDARGLSAMDYARNRSDENAVQIVHVLEPHVKSESGS